MDSGACDYGRLGITFPNYVEYKTRVHETLQRNNLAMPDELSILIAEYGSSYTIKFASTHYQDTLKRIQSKVNRLILSPVLPTKFHRFTGIKILASVPTDTDGYIDLLSDQTWHKRYNRIVQASRDILQPDDAVIHIPPMFPPPHYVMHAPDRYSAALGFDSKIF